MTMTIKHVFVAALILTLGVGVSFAGGSNGAGKILTLNLKGTGQMYIGLVPDVDGDGQDDEAMCFDVDLFDLSTGQLMGAATDCLYQPMEDGDGLILVGTAFFDFQGGSSLITRGVTTVHPGQPESLNGFTHITGAAPSGASDVIGGTGRYHSASGSVRLSGLVDMSNLDAEGEITFDCIFVVTLD